MNTDPAPAKGSISIDENFAAILDLPRKRREVESYALRLHEGAAPDATFVSDFIRGVAREFDWISVREDAFNQSVTAVFTALRATRSGPDLETYTLQLRDFISSPTETPEARQLGFYALKTILYFLDKTPENHALTQRTAEELARIAGGANPGHLFTNECLMLLRELIDDGRLQLKEDMMRVARQATLNGQTNLTAKTFLTSAFAGASAQPTGDVEVVEGFSPPSGRQPRVMGDIVDVSPLGTSSRRKAH